MLFKYLFLLATPDLVCFFPDKKEKFDLVIPLTRNSLLRKTELFRQMYSIQHNFCFSITTELMGVFSQSREEIIGFLTTALFAPNYSRYKGQYIILFDKDAASEFGDVKEYMLSELAKQGIRDVVSNDLQIDHSALNSAGNTCFANVALEEFLEPGDRGVIFESLIQKVLTTFSIDKKWIISVVNKDEIDHKLKLLSQFESHTFLTYPLLSNLIRMQQLADDKRVELASENEILKTKLQNTNDNLKVLRDSALWYVYEYDKRSIEVQNKSYGVIDKPETFPTIGSNDLEEKVRSLQRSREEILEWYRKEYEVLPRWYKMFGHIIKAIMGKRTFKSLVK